MFSPYIGNYSESECDDQNRPDWKPMPRKFGPHLKGNSRFEKLRNTYQKIYRSQIHRIETRFTSKAFSSKEQHPSGEDQYPFLEKREGFDKLCLQAEYSNCTEQGRYDRLKAHYDQMKEYLDRYFYVVLFIEVDLIIRTRVEKNGLSIELPAFKDFKVALEERNPFVNLSPTVSFDISKQVFVSTYHEDRVLKRNVWVMSLQDQKDKRAQILREFRATEWDRVYACPQMVHEFHEAVRIVEPSPAGGVKVHKFQRSFDAIGWKIWQRFGPDFMRHANSEYAIYRKEWVKKCGHLQWQLAQESIPVNQFRTEVEHEYRAMNDFMSSYFDKLLEDKVELEYQKWLAEMKKTLVMVLEEELPPHHVFVVSGEKVSVELFTTGHRIQGLMSSECRADPKTPSWTRGKLAHESQNSMIFGLKPKPMFGDLIDDEFTRDSSNKTEEDLKEDQDCSTAESETGKAPAPMPDNARKIPLPAGSRNGNKNYMSEELYQRRIGLHYGPGGIPDRTDQGIGAARGNNSKKRRSPELMDGMESSKRPRCDATTAQPSQKDGESVGRAGESGSQIGKSPSLAINVSDSDDDDGPNPPPDRGSTIKRGHCDESDSDGETETLSDVESRLDPAVNEEMLQSVSGARSQNPPVKRKRGRPRKNPFPEPQANTPGPSQEPATRPRPVPDNFQEILLHRVPAETQALAHATRGAFSTSPEPLQTSHPSSLPSGFSDEMLEPNQPRRIIAVRPSFRRLPRVERPRIEPPPADRKQKLASSQLNSRFSSSMTGMLVNGPAGKTSLSQSRAPIGPRAAQSHGLQNAASGTMTAAASNGMQTVSYSASLRSRNPEVGMDGRPLGRPPARPNGLSRQSISGPRAGAAGLPNQGFTQIPVLAPLPTFASSSSNGGYMSNGFSGPVREGSEIPPRGTGDTVAHGQAPRSSSMTNGSSMTPSRAVAGARQTLDQARERAKISQEPRGPRIQRSGSTRITTQGNQPSHFQRFHDPRPQNSVNGFPSPPYSTQSWGIQNMSLGIQPGSQYAPQISSVHYPPNGASSPSLAVFGQNILQQTPHPGIFQDSPLAFNQGPGNVYLRPQVFSPHSPHGYGEPMSRQRSQYGHSQLHQDMFRQRSANGYGVSRNMTAAREPHLSRLDFKYPYATQIIGSPDSSNVYHNPHRSPTENNSMVMTQQSPTVGDSGQALASYSAIAVSGYPTPQSLTGVQEAQSMSRQRSSTGSLANPSSHLAYQSSRSPGTPRINQQRSMTPQGMSQSPPPVSQLSSGTGLASQQSLSGPGPRVTQPSSQQRVLPSSQPISQTQEAYERLFARGNAARNYIRARDMPRSNQNLNQQQLQNKAQPQHQNRNSPQSSPIEVKRRQDIQPQHAVYGENINSVIGHGRYNIFNNSLQINLSVPPAANLIHSSHSQQVQPNGLPPPNLTVQPLQPVGQSTLAGQQQQQQLLQHPPQQFLTPSNLEEPATGFVAQASSLTNGNPVAQGQEMPNGDQKLDIDAFMNELCDLSRLADGE